MNRTDKTPIAWLNLTHDPRRLISSLAGIGFAVILMFTELGFLNALYDSTTALIGLLSPAASDLLMIHAEKESLVDSRRFPRRRLYQAQAIPGVAAARPLYVERMNSIWEAPARGEEEAKQRRIRVVATYPADDLLRLPPGAPELDLPGTALFDLSSKPGLDYKRLVREASRGEPVRAVLSRRPIEVVGTFRLGTDFANDGNLIVSTATFDRFFPLRRIDDPDVATVDLGLIRLEQGADPVRVRHALEGLGQVLVMTPDELEGRETLFWQKRTPIGPIFKLGTFLGFIVGVVICFQVLASDVRDRLSEYATLKAIGYSDREPAWIVLRQATWLAVLGFGVGLVVSTLIYIGLDWQTGLPMRMKPGWVLFVFGLTVGMCWLSAWLAIRKLMTADPAELFR